MTDPKNEVLFCEYCKTCKHKLCDCEDEPCCDCLAAPVNYYSHKPVLWEGVDTLFNKPVERRDHAAERAVREAVYLNAKDTAEVIDEQGTLAGKVHMRDLVSWVIDCINRRCIVKPLYTYGEMKDIVLNMLVSKRLFSNATKINTDVTFGWEGWEYINIPDAETIDKCAFSNCHSLNLEQPDVIDNVTIIGNRAFSNCYRFGDGWEQLNFDNVTTIGESAFYNCYSIKKVIMPNVTDIPNSAFLNCYSLKKVILDCNKILSIGNDAFHNCTSLRYINSGNSSGFNAHKLKKIGNQAFANSAIWNISCSNLTEMGWGAFDNCTSLKSAYFTNNEIVIPTSAFYGCTALEQVRCKATKIKNLAFEDCTNLKELEFDNTSSIPMLGDRSLPSPIWLRSDFRIYVEDNLYRQWINDNGWAEYADYIFPSNYKFTSDRKNYPTINIAHSDGGKLLSRKADVRIGEETVPFVVKMQLDDNMEVSSVFADNIDVTNNSVIGLVNNSITVEPIDGISYGFALQSQTTETYVSQNEGKHNTAALCRIKFVLSDPCNVVIHVANSGEKNYDYGMLGKIDEVLTASSSADSASKIQWSAKGVADNNGYADSNVSYSIPSGTHYIYVKYIKDSGVSKGNDNFRFNIANKSSIITTKPVTRISYSNFDTISEDHDFYVQLSKKTT